MTAVAPTLQAALDDWAACEPKLRALADKLEAAPDSGQRPLQNSGLARSRE